MVKHVIIWALKEDAKKNPTLKMEIKEKLEGLLGKIEGLTEMKIITEGLPSSSGDLMLDSTFVDADALKYYAGHPEHVAVADGWVRPNVETRLAFDFEI